MNNVDFIEFNEADVCYEGFQKKMKVENTRLSCKKEVVGSDAMLVMNTWTY